MRSLILNRTNSNDRGRRQDRRDVAVVNGLGTALRASFSFFRHAAEHLAGYRAPLECLPAAAAPCARPATSVSGRQGGMSQRQGGWQFKPAVPRGSKRKS